MVYPFILFRKKFTFACDKTLRAQGLCSFCTNSRSNSAEIGEQLATIILKSPWKALGTGAKIGSGLASENSNTILFTIAELKNFCHN